MPAYAGMTNYDTVSDGGGGALRSRSYTTQFGRAATKGKTNYIPPPFPSPSEGREEGKWSPDLLNKISRN